MVETSLQRKKGPFVTNYSNGEKIKDIYKFTKKIGSGGFGTVYNG